MTRRPTALCVRCGVERTVKPERDSTGLCRDCLAVEADLARRGCGVTDRPLSGYYWHQKRGEVPCADCVEAKRLQEERARRRRGIKPRQPARCGTDSGYFRHRRNGEVPCIDCRRAHSAANRGKRHKEAAA